MATEVIEVKDQESIRLWQRHNLAFMGNHTNLQVELCACYVKPPTITTQPVSRFAAASGMTCVQCGGSNLLQTGTCFTCNDCGGTGGCG